MIICWWVFTAEGSGSDIIGFTLIFLVLYFLYSKNTNKIILSKVEK